MASEQDAARDRVLAARAELGEQVQALQASARAAADVPAHIKRNPVKAAAVAGTAGFVVLKGPQRLFRAVRRRLPGYQEPLAQRVLPEEVEKRLRRLGKDGDKVRAALERDYAGYIHTHETERRGAATAMLLAAARPLLIRGAKSVAQALASPDSSELGRRLAEVRGRAAGGVEAARDRASEGVDEVRDRAGRAKDAAQDRVASIRRDTPDPGADESGLPGA